MFRRHHLFRLSLSRSTPSSIFMLIRFVLEGTPSTRMYNIHASNKSRVKARMYYTSAMNRDGALCSCCVASKRTSLLGHCVRCTREILSTWGRHPTNSKTHVRFGRVSLLNAYGTTCHQCVLYLQGIVSPSLHPRQYRNQSIKKATKIIKIYGPAGILHHKTSVPHYAFD